MSTTPEQPVRPAGRYGEDHPAWHRVAARAAVIALAVLGVAWVVWAGLAAGSKVNATVVTWTVVDPTRMQVALDVTMNPGSSAVCTVEARNNRQATVGQTSITIPATTAKTQRVNADINTQERGASVIVNSCSGT